MRKMIFLGWLVVFLPAMVFAQDKIEAPVWSVGDKWTFTGDGTIEVMKADANSYMLKFSERNCMVETQGFSAILFDKASLNRIHSLEGDKRKKYREGLTKIFEFPFSVGKEWKYNHPGIVAGWAGPVAVDFFENYKVSGWEDIVVGAGKFKTIKLEFAKHSVSFTGVTGVEVKHVYWYSPDVKYFVKCQYDKDWMKDKKEIFNWELTSFQLKK